MSGISALSGIKLLLLLTEPGTEPGVEPTVSWLTAPGVVPGVFPADPNESRAYRRRRVLGRNEEGVEPGVIRSSDGSLHAGDTVSVSMAVLEPLEQVRFALFLVSSSCDCGVSMRAG